MFAKTTILGYIGKDPETRSVSANASVTVATIAATERFKDRAGNPVDRTHWYDVEIWNKYGETFAKYARKGDKVLIDGKLLTDKYEDKNGIVRKKMFVRTEQWVILERKENRGTAAPTSQVSDSAPQSSNPPRPSAAPSAPPRPSAKPTAPSPAIASVMPIGMDDYMEKDDDLPF